MISRAFVTIARLARTGSAGKKYSQAEGSKTTPGYAADREHRGPVLGRDRAALVPGRST